MGSRGGARAGSGRPKGRNNKCITLTLPIPAYEVLIRDAEAAGSTVSQYIIDKLKLPRNESENKQDDEFNISAFFMAAEEAKPYGQD